MTTTPALRRGNLFYAIDLETIAQLVDFQIELSSALETVSDAVTELKDAIEMIDLPDYEDLTRASPSLSLDEGSLPF